MRSKSHLDFNDKRSVSAELAYRVKGAFVAWANFKALRRDFVQLSTLSDAEICDWLVQNFAYIGSQQSKLNGIRNSPIPIDEHDRKWAFRQESWIRAATLNAYHPQNQDEIIGMVDIKGFGFGDLSLDQVTALVAEFERAQHSETWMQTLQTQGHSDGLMTGGESIAEMTRQEALQRLFEMSDLGYETVESYAMIQLPFGVLRPEGEVVPAMLYLRQANQERLIGLPVPSEIYSDARGKFQSTNLRTLIDFGGVIINDSRLNGDPTNGISFGEVVKDEPQSSYPWIWGHRVAWAFNRKDNADLSAIYRHEQEMLQPLLADYENSPLVRKRQFEQKAILRYIAWLSSQKKSYTEIRERLLETNKMVKLKYKQWNFLLDHTGPSNTDSLDNVLGEILTSVRPIPPEILIKALNRATPGRRALVTSRLFLYPGPGQLDAIRRGLSDPSQTVQIEAARALADCKEAGAVGLIADTLTQKKSVYTNDSLIRALRSHQGEDAVALLEEILKGTDNHAKKIALESLAGRSSVRVETLLQKALRDASEISTMALTVLVENHPTERVKLVSEAIERRDVEFSAYTANLMAAQNDANALQAILKFKDREPGADERVVGALVRMTLPEALPHIMSYARASTHVQAVRLALDYFQRVTDPQLPALMDRAIRDFGENPFDKESVTNAVLQVALAHPTAEYKRFVVEAFKNCGPFQRHYVANWLRESPYRFDQDIIDVLKHDSDGRVAAIGHEFSDNASDSILFIKSKMADVNEREVGLKLLIKRNDEASFGILKDYLADFDISKIDGLEALVPRHNPEALKLLSKFIHYKLDFVAREAIAILGKRDDQESIVLFDEAFALSEKALRVNAFEALLKRTDSGAEIYKKALLSRTDIELSGTQKFELIKSLKLLKLPQPTCQQELVNLESPLVN